jgi:hypothetical protein
VTAQGAGAGGPERFGAGPREDDHDQRRDQQQRDDLWVPSGIQVVADPAPGLSALPMKA